MHERYASALIPKPTVVANDGMFMQSALKTASKMVAIKNKTKRTSTALIAKP